MNDAQFDQEARQVAALVLHLWDAPQVVKDFLSSGDPELREPARSEATLHSRQVEKSRAGQAAAEAAMWAAAYASVETIYRRNQALFAAALALQAEDENGDIYHAQIAITNAQAAVRAAQDTVVLRRQEYQATRQEVYQRALTSLVEEAQIDPQTIQDK